MDLSVSAHRRPLETAHRNPPSAFATHQSVFDASLLKPPHPCTGILSRIARQLHHFSLPPRGARPQEPRCDRAPRLPPKHQLRPQRVLRHCQRRGEQQPRALRRRPIRVARPPAAQRCRPVTRGSVRAFAHGRLWRGGEETDLAGHVRSLRRVSLLISSHLISHRVGFVRTSF